VIKQAEIKEPLPKERGDLTHAAHKRESQSHQHFAPQQQQQPNANPLLAFIAPLSPN